MSEDPIESLHEALSRGLKREAPVSREPFLKPPLPPPIRVDREEVRNSLTCYRKRGYASAQEAGEKLNETEAITPGLKLYSYKCRACHRWHLTKSRPSKTL